MNLRCNAFLFKMRNTFSSIRSGHSPFQKNQHSSLCWKLDPSNMRTHPLGLSRPSGLQSVNPKKVIFKNLPYYGKLLLYHQQATLDGAACTLCRLRGRSCAECNAAINQSITRTHLAGSGGLENFFDCMSGLLGREVDVACIAFVRKVCRWRLHQHELFFFLVSFWVVNRACRDLDAGTQDLDEVSGSFNAGKPTASCPSDDLCLFRPDADGVETKGYISIYHEDFQPSHESFDGQT